MKNRKFVDSVNNAVNGIVEAIKSEKNMKIHSVAVIAVLSASLFFGLDKIELSIVLLSIGLVITAELINTAVEKAIDIITSEYHPAVKVVKDIAAGAVLVSAFIALIVGYIVFYDKFSKIIEVGIVNMKHIPINIAVIAFGVTLVLVFVIKAIYGKGKPLSGGMPSGHAALAFASVASIAFITENVGVTSICFLLALLVVQSRYEAGIHSMVELLIGAFLGIIVTLLFFKIFMF